MILHDRECHKARDAGGRYGRSRPRSVLDAQGVAVGSIRTGSTLPGSSIAFTLSASVEGGCKRIPGFMCSEYGMQP